MWIHIPSSISSLSAPGSEDSSLESISPDLALASSVWSRGKRTQPKFWRHAWNKARFPRLLSGATSPPSTASRGVALWIASLAATRVSQTASPGSNSAPTMTDGCSNISFGSSMKCGLVISSARTFRGMPTDNSQSWSRHWKEWVTALRLDYSARRKSDFLTDDSDFSSWPTAAARDYRSPNSADSQEARNEGKKRGQQLMNFIEHQWPTPGANAFDENPETFAARNEALADSRSKGASGIPLSVLASQWATPQAHDSTQGSADRVGRFGTEHGGRNLTDDVQMWGTPTPTDRRRNEETMAKGLEYRAKSGRKGVPLYLGEQLDRWETPTAALTNGKRQTRSGDRSDELLLTGQALATSEAASPTPPQDQTTPDGPGSSPTRRTLNPLFVEWMHGWPTGWTDSETPVTGFRVWLERSRSELSRLLLPRGIETSLFD